MELLMDGGRVNVDGPAIVKGLDCRFQPVNLCRIRHRLPITEGFMPAASGLFPASYMPFGCSKCNKPKPPARALHCSTAKGGKRDSTGSAIFPYSCVRMRPALR